MNVLKTSKIVQKMMDDARMEGKIVYKKDLANALGTSKSNFTNKMQRNSFSLNDIACIANYLGFKVIITGKGKAYEIKRED